MGDPHAADRLVNEETYTFAELEQISGPDLADRCRRIAGVPVPRRQPASEMYRDPVVDLLRGSRR